MDGVVIGIVSIVAEDSPHAFLDVYVSVCCEFACHVDVAVSSHGLDSDPRVWILLETRVEDDIGDLVTEFVWMCWTYAFSGAEREINHKKVLKK